MLADSSAVPDESARDLIRRIVGWCADVHFSNPHYVAHRGPCGERFMCDIPEHQQDGHPRVEMLPGGEGHNPGELIFHCEGPHATLRPSDPLYEQRRAGLTKRGAGRDG